MPTPDARIESTSLGADGRFNQRSMRDTQRANELQYGADYVDPTQFRKTEAYVYIYSVVDPRPRGAKLTRSFPPLLPHLEIRECPQGEPYVLITKLPHPINQMIMRENGERYIDSHDAKRVAMDVVNPDNLTLDQDYVVNPTNMYSQGNDYGRLGVFWSMSAKPSAEEVEKAIARKEEYYRARLQEARKLEMTNPKELYAYLSVIDHIAADYFGEEYSWHKRPQKPVFCPNCGEQMREGAGFHASQALGTICVNDWKMAVKAGVKKRDDVPIEQRWWSPKDKEASREGQPASG